MIGIENIIKKYIYKFNIFKNIYYKLDIDLDLAIRIEFLPNYYKQREKYKKNVIKN